MYLHAVYNYGTVCFLFNSGFLTFTRFYISLRKFNISQKFLLQNHHKFFSLVSSSQSLSALKFVSCKSLLRNDFIYIQIFNHLILWVFSILLHIFSYKEGLWDCYFGITKDDSVTCALYGMRFWRHVKKATSSNCVARHVLLKYTLALQFDQKGPSAGINDKNIQRKSSVYKHESYIKNKISFFHKLVKFFKQHSWITWGSSQWHVITTY